MLSSAGRPRFRLSVPPGSGIALATTRYGYPERNTLMRKLNSTWIADWNPEDETFWKSTGRSIAQRNLIWSIFAEHLGFSIWLHLEHRRNQVAGGRLSLHDGPTVPACRAARTDRLADAVFPIRLLLRRSAAGTGQFSVRRCCSYRRWRSRTSSPSPIRRSG